MSAPRYRGPVETVEQAMWAGMVLEITCQRCSRSASMWACKLETYGPRAAALPLNRAVDGFFCKGCHRRVQAWISARREGEL